MLPSLTIHAAHDKLSRKEITSVELTQALLDRIDPRKDVDGLHPVSVGHLVENMPGFVPCTPHGVIKMIESTGTDIKGKDALVIGRSNIVGKPVAILLMHRHATVTICHSRTVNLPEKVSRAEILVAAIGKAKFVKGDWIKPGAVVIDVGWPKADVDFASVSQKASVITPVPGGVGPLTVICLLENLLQACYSSPYHSHSGSSLD